MLKTIDLCINTGCGGEKTNIVGLPLPVPLHLALVLLPYGNIDALRSVVTPGSLLENNHSYVQEVGMERRYSLVLLSPFNNFSASVA